MYKAKFLFSLIAEWPKLSKWKNSFKNLLSKATAVALVKMLWKSKLSLPGMSSPAPSHLPGCNHDAFCGTASSTQLPPSDNPAEWGLGKELFCDRWVKDCTFNLEILCCTIITTGKERLWLIQHNGPPYQLAPLAVEHSGQTPLLSMGKPKAATKRHRLEGLFSSYHWLAYKTLVPLKFKKGSCLIIVFHLFSVDV